MTSFAIKKSLAHMLNELFHTQTVVSFVALKMANPINIISTKGAK
jgi:hypothetical protein